MAYVVLSGSKVRTVDELVQAGKIVSHCPEIQGNSMTAEGEPYLIHTKDLSSPQIHSHNGLANHMPLWEAPKPDLSIHSASLPLFSRSWCFKTYCFCYWW